MPRPDTGSEGKRSGAPSSEWRRRIVARAEAFLAAHIDEPVSVARLCQALAINERSLRRAFHDVRGMSPKRRAVHIRLAGVRNALRRAESTRVTVTAIATEYGFYELGRFAGTYKAVFGETPSATLRGGRELRAAS